MIDVDRENERILKEDIDGDTIYDLVLQDKMKSAYVEQLHHMCELLYAANTNIDYFPTNFVVQKDEIYYIDFECNDYMEEWNFENWGVILQTARIYSGVPGKVPGWRSAVGLYCKFNRCAV